MLASGFTPGKGMKLPSRQQTRGPWCTFPEVFGTPERFESEHAFSMAEVAQNKCSFRRCTADVFAL